jgi:hypothetical protein
MDDAQDADSRQRKQNENQIHVRLIRVIRKVPLIAFFKLKWLRIM